MVIRLVLDTSAYSHFRSGHSTALSQVESAPYVVIPSIVVGELETAFQLGSKGEQNRQLLQEFLDLEFVELWTVDVQVARVYGLLVAHLRRSGTPIPINDIWIAACTLACGGHLLTFDDDFQAIEEIQDRLILLR